MPDFLKIVLTLSSQLPLAGGLWLGWNQVKERPGVALLLGLLYEAGVFALAFGKKVWVELEKDAVKVSADWVRGAARGLTSGFQRRYRKQVLDEHGGFNVRGLGLINTYRLSLEQVFVELRIDPSNPQLFNRNLLSKRELAGNRPVWEFLRSNKSGEPDVRALSIIGPPGCGKTTLLRHVALTLAANRQRRHGLRSYTPILLFLRDHLNAVTQAKPPSLGTLMQDYCGDAQLFATLKPPAGWFEHQLERGRCMVLLDGLDEVAEVQQRRAVSAWVDTQIKNYPRCPFVLTARPQGYLDAPLERADVVLEVQPFNAEQVWKFIRSWYLANEMMSSGGKTDAGVQARARTDAEDLMQRLRAVPALSALTVNPLLLTMIAMVHRYRGALPGSRVELYAEICEVLLERWRQVRGIKDMLDLKAAQKLVVLRPLAAHMMKHKLRDISTDDVLPVITPTLERVGVARDAAKDFLVNLQDSSGLLVEREAEQWSFAHLTFQEYLTAAYWLEQKVANQNWRALVGDSWWHETLRLYAAQGDATPLVRACLEVDDVPSLTLAADCLEDNGELDPEVRRLIEARVIADLEATDPARRRLAAEVQLARRLKSLLPIDEQREIDLEYLTCAEYQLFLDDMHGEDRYYQPDHWTDISFAQGEARQPVIGVRGTDAVDFCDWLTRRQGGAVRFRLPYVHEALQYPPTLNTLTTWCLDGKMFQTIGLAEPERQRITRQLTELSSFSPYPILVSTLDGSHTFALARAFFLATARDIKHNSAERIDRARPLSRDLAFARLLTDILARDRDLIHLLNLDRQFARLLIEDLVDIFDQTHVHSLYEEVKEIKLAIDRNKLTYAQRLVKMLVRFGARPHWIALVSDILNTATMESLLQRRRARREYLSRMIEYTRGGTGDYPRRQAISELYWWLQIVMAREDGRLHAWEGIRIVREQILDTGVVIVDEGKSHK